MKGIFYNFICSVVSYSVKHRFGFKVIREVEDSLLDRMTWGAEGTLMELNINDFFELWTPKFRNLAENFE